MRALKFFGACSQNDLLRSVVMKRFGAKPLFLTLVVLLCDWSAYYCLSRMFLTLESGSKTGGMINSVRKSEADVVILGSSRAKHHYDPDILQDVLGTSVVNAGCDGQELSLLLWFFVRFFKRIVAECVYSVATLFCVSQSRVKIPL